MSIAEKLTKINDNVPLIYDSGVFEGYTEGMNQGYSEGYAEGETIGYSYGETDGYMKGREEGYSQGYSEGEAEGHFQGRQEGYSQGYTAGEESATNVCHAKHYATVIQGSGTTTLSFHVPFEPDLICIVGFDPTCLLVKYTNMLFVYDVAAFGLMGGFVVTSKGSNVQNGAMTTVSALSRYSRDEAGTVTIQKIVAISGNPEGVFAKNVMYSVTAVKYTDKTDKERITEMINGLTGSGSLTLNRTKVNAAFTDEEWSDLIATKPDWTFAFVG